MDTFQPTKAGRYAYMRRTLKAQQSGDGAVFGAGKVLSEAGGLGAEFVRHAIMVMGVVGLVGIAVGALTDAPLYYKILNWVTCWFA
jgi:hypothetical protein